MGTGNNMCTLCGFNIYSDADDRSDLTERGRAAARAFSPPLLWGHASDPQAIAHTVIGTETSMRASMYGAWLYDVPGVYTECTPASGAEARYAEGLQRVQEWLGMIDRAPAVPRPSPPRLHVENTEAGSGHVQSNNMSPCDGLFRPAKQLWDKIEAGDTLGVVTNPFGQVLHTVTSGHGGTLIMHAQLRRVAAGDALALVI